MKKAVGRSVLTGLLALLVAVVGLPTQAASAHGITGNNWRANHTICQTCAVRSGNIVRLWQSMLWADRYVGDSTAFIDGSFGPDTRAATIRWQRAHGLTGDGSVGPDTWSKAKQYVLSLGHIENGWEEHAFPNPAASRQLALRKNTRTGVWQFANPRASGLVWTNADH
ncbi:MAG TPA: peptidoglycan-binding domain-containing protein [Catenuloplanes sp.]|jgi:peptidoglycan hydrolase-like protein with peptidoglycan-binding domain